MNIILKNSLKNIFGKFFRTLLVTFAIFMCCLCALLSFDLVQALEGIVTNYLSTVSRADFMAFTGGSDLNDLPDGFPESDYMTAVVNNEMVYKPIDGEYAFVTTEFLNIYGLDVDGAVDMEFMTRIDIADGEMYVSKEFAEDYGYEVGDTFIAHDRADEEVELRIAGIFPDDMKNPVLTGASAIVNLNTGYKLSCGDEAADIILIDVKDNSKIQDAIDMYRDTFPDASITELFLSDSDNMMLSEIRGVFYMLFAITFLLVIFVTASICNRIVSERMSFIGTLRSLGMSTGRTAGILLLENVIYALLGSVPSVVLYSLVRNPMLTALFGLDNESISGLFEIPELSIALVIGVILMAVAIECLIPLKAILKALKTSIRDIIFDNRDTEYRYSKSAFITGLVFLGIAVITFFFRAKIGFAIICLISAVVALALLFPRILKLVATGIRKFSDKHDMATWSLAAAEASTKKSTVSSGVLSATAAAMCIIVYAVATAMGVTVSDVPYECDVVMGSTKQLKYYSYIEHIDTVTEVVPLYYSMQEFQVGDEDSATYGYLYGMADEGFGFYTGFENLDALEDGKIYVDKKYASRKGISADDTITLTLNPNGAFPIVREYTVQDVIESNPYDAGTEAIIVSLTEYKALLLDYPGEILIKCGDPETVRDALKTYAKGDYTDVKTLDDIVTDNTNNNSKTVAVVTAIIAVALGMTAVGMISNQLIGFEGRKKECAVMLSTAMGKGKLSGILLKEVLITSFTASALGTLLGSVLTLVLHEAFINTQALVLDVTVDPVKNLVFFVILTILFTLTVLFPIKNLRKMKISEQIKYE
jgi:ABC-type antimicrobial peptide transport system permease subunit